MRKFSIILLVCFMVSGLTATSTFAGTIGTWVHEGTVVGNWNDPLMWMSSAVPIPTTNTGDEIKLLTPNGVTTIDSVMNYNCRLTIAGGANDIDKHRVLILPGADATFSEVRVGHGGAGGRGTWGAINQTGGTLTVDKLQLGYYGTRQPPLAKGYYTISSGTLQMSSGSTGRLMVGCGITMGATSANNEGVFTVVGIGGAISMKDLYVGGYSTYVGTGTVAFEVAEDGVSPITVSNGINLSASGIANLNVTLTGAAPTGNILLIENTGTSLVSGIFDSFNGGSAAEGAQVTIDGGLYTLTYVYDADGDDADNDIALIPEPPTVLTPTFEPDGGGYRTDQQVIIRCATSAATIHYTMNGLDPTEEDPNVESGDSVLVTMNSQTTLKAKAFKDGWTPSDVKTAVYYRTFIRYVSTSGSDDSNGLSWTDAKRTVRAAIGDAQAGDEIWVAAGTYTPMPTTTTASFQGVGPPEAGYSDVSGVSRDGLVVVGRGFGVGAFRWTEANGIVGLGNLPDSNYTRSDAYAASGNGSVIVGSSEVSSPPPRQAFRWTSAAGMVGIGWLPGGEGDRSWAKDVSSNGSVVIGTSYRYKYEVTNPEAFRWTAGGGMVGLGYLPGGYASFGLGVSADGLFVVGTSWFGGVYNLEATRWTWGGATTALGDLAGGNLDGAAFDVSDDGNVVVGYSSSSSYPDGEAFRWTSGGGMIGLGALPDATESTAMAVSADGSAVVGYCVSGGGWETFYWNATTGMVSLRDLLVDTYGLDLTDWTLGSTAVGISADGLTIVGGGSYKGNGQGWIARIEILVDRTISFVMKPGVAIYGGFTGTETNLDQRDWVANQTILSGEIGDQGNSDNSYHVVVGANNSVLDGFTITGGNTNEDVNDFGGGMKNVESSPTVANCAFIGNSASGGSESYGGGMGDSNNSPTVTNCTFSSNIAIFGGGMGNIASSPTVEGCIFTDNTASWSGGGMANHESSNPTVTNCTFTDNSAYYDSAGGMYNETDCSPIVTSCTFNGNQAWNGGGGMKNTGGSNPRVTNCSFSGNSAVYGGGIDNDNSNPTVTNCTFSNNSAEESGGGIDNYESSATITNCILWGNTAPQIYDDLSSSTVTYSDIQGNLWLGTGNINADPCFVGSGNYRLLRGSPCIDAGDNNAVPAGVVIDLDSFPRFIDDLLTNDTGNGIPPIVDMGAYEFLRSDISRDGVVNFVDLALFMSQWLQTGCGECDGADLTGDGQVNLADFIELAKWWRSGTTP